MEHRGKEVGSKQLVYLHLAILQETNMEGERKQVASFKLNVVAGDKQGRGLQTGGLPAFGHLKMEKIMEEGSQ